MFWGLIKKTIMEIWFTIRIKKTAYNKGLAEVTV